MASLAFPVRSWGERRGQESPGEAAWDAGATCEQRLLTPPRSRPEVRRAVRGNDEEAIDQRGQRWDGLGDGWGDNSAAASLLVGAGYSCARPAAPSVCVTCDGEATHHQPRTEQVMGKGNKTPKKEVRKPKQDKKTPKK